MTNKQKSKSAGWVFDYSSSLKFPYAWRKTPQGIEIMTEDKVRYTAKEVKIISDTIGEITPQIHTIKRIMGGEIVESEGVLRK